MIRFTSGSLLWDPMGPYYGPQKGPYFGTLYKRRKKIMKKYIRYLSGPIGFFSGEKTDFKSLRFLPNKLHLNYA